MLIEQTSHAIKMEISEYERRRLDNIDKNNQYLIDIGLESSTNKRSAAKPLRSKKRDPIAVVPTRRSSRNEGKTVNYQDPVVNFPSKRSRIHSDSEEERKPSILSIKGEFIVPDGMQYDAPIVQSSSGSSNSSSQLNADISLFLAQYLCLPVKEYGKAAVMTMANYNSMPKFSKYSGVVEWKNAIFLWVNIGGQTGYHNNFSENGKNMMWYGGSRMHAGRYCVILKLWFTM